MVNPVFSRIMLRVIAGALIGWGFKEVAEILTSEPEIVTIISHGVEVVVGGVVWAVSEVWYLIAKKRGGRT